VGWSSATAPYLAAYEPSQFFQKSRNRSAIARVFHGVLDVLVTEVVLQRTRDTMQRRGRWMNAQHRASSGLPGPAALPPKKSIRI
jgi:hypothetical protein